MKTYMRAKSPPRLSKANVLFKRIMVITIMTYFLSKIYKVQTDMTGKILRKIPEYIDPILIKNSTTRHESNHSLSMTQQSIKNSSTTTATKKNRIDCGCPHSCDEVALAKHGQTFRCINRIEFLMERYNTSELQACEASSEVEPFVGKTNKPCDIECNPKFCKEMKERPKMDLSNVEVPNPTFERYEGVVIATKAFNSNSLPALKQMFCLLHAAYNRFVNYDLLVFTTVPWSESDIRELQVHVAPAKLTVALEGPPTLEGYLANMTKQERDFLDKRCNVKKGQNISWAHYCTEPGSQHKNNLSYCWQAEFRTYHIWNHPAIRKYKYMIWFDTDTFCTKTWEVDPMKVFIENKLNLLFDKFPGGSVYHKELREKMVAAYNRSICGVSLVSGKLRPKKCESEDSIARIHQVYGFNHITRLEMYRKAEHMKLLHSLVNKYKFPRQLDDQLAVTLPAVIEDPSKCWDMQANGLNLTLHHNMKIDGRYKTFGYRKFWQKRQETWTAGRAMCNGFIFDSG